MSRACKPGAPVAKPSTAKSDYRRAEFSRLFDALCTLLLDEARDRASQGGQSGARIRHDKTGLERKKVLFAIRTGALAAVKIGKFFYVEPAVLDAYFASHATTTEEAPVDAFTAAMQRSGLRRGKGAAK